MNRRDVHRRPPFWTAKYADRPGPTWSLPALMTIITVIGVGRGLDLALDPEVSNEIYSYADYLGINTWGWIQALACVTPLVMLALRWQAGVMLACLSAAAVWAAYALVILQGTLPVIFELGGLRNALVPLQTCALFVLCFALAVYRYRTALAEGESMCSRRGQ